MTDKGWTKKSSPRDASASRLISRLGLGGMHSKSKAEARRKQVLKKQREGRGLPRPGILDTYDPSKAISTSPRRASLSPPFQAAIPHAHVGGLKRTSAAMLRDSAQQCVTGGTSISPRHRAKGWPPPNRKQRKTGTEEPVLVSSDDDDDMDCDSDDESILTGAPPKGSPLRQSAGINLIPGHRRKQTPVRRVMAFPPKQVAPKSCFDVNATMFSERAATASSDLCFYDDHIRFPVPGQPELVVRFDSIEKILYFPHSVTETMNRSILSLRFSMSTPLLKGGGGYAGMDKYVSLVLPHDLTSLLQELQKTTLAEGVLQIVESTGMFGEEDTIRNTVRSKYRLLKTTSHERKMKTKALSESRQTTVKQQSRLALGEGAVTLVSQRVTLKSMDVLTWPPPPAKGAITLNTVDLMRLQQGEFLNDQVIDFYLKYLISTCPQESVHVFNSHFYKRGSQKPKDVLRWTKGVDIFKKRFLLVPVHDHAHWLLAIVCFPCGAIDGQPIVDLGHDASDEQRALAFEETRILFFDSLSTSTTTAARRIRQFLDEIWKKDHADTPRSFSAVNAVCVDVPQQDNSWDCGVFVMQYAEEFLKKLSPDPADYSSTWFSIERVKRKRREFLRLVKKLAEEQNVELDKQVERFLSGHYEGSRARTASADISHVQTFEKNGIILLDESDGEDTDLEITASCEDTEDLRLPSNEGCAIPTTALQLTAPIRPTGGRSELPQSLLGSSVARDAADLPEVILASSSEDRPVRNSVFRPRVIDDDDSAGDDNFALELLRE